MIHAMIGELHKVFWDFSGRINNWGTQQKFCRTDSSCFKPMLLGSGKRCLLKAERMWEQQLSLCSSPKGPWFWSAALLASRTLNSHAALPARLPWNTSSWATCWWWASWVLCCGWVIRPFFLLLSSYGSLLVRRKSPRSTLWGGIVMTTDHCFSP